MSLQVRPAAESDPERIADILIESRAAFMPYAPSAHTEDEVRAWVQHHLLPTGGVTVAVLDGVVVGVLAVSSGGGYSWIDQMYVHPSLVSQGIGTRLLDHAIAVLPRPIRLYTFQQNVGARRFYERHGFQAVAFSDGQDNEEHCPDVLYELRARSAHGG